MSAIMHDQLGGYVGQSIGQICNLGFASPAQNHCAHFVSHALGINVSVLCGDMQYATRHRGATIRCNELYNNLAVRGPWSARPKSAVCLLAFVVSARNVVSNFMHDVPQKHVGIVYGSDVYNYSNTHHQVVCDKSPQMFLSRFQGLYSGGDISLFFGVYA